MSRKSFRIELAIDRLRERFTNLYFLTLTTPDRCTCRQVSARWRSLINDRYWRRLGISYVEVLEKHPGGHGWHIHAVVSSRIPVKDFRPVVEHHGFGRFHIVLCNRHLERICRYLSKYIGKNLRLLRDPDTKGVRLVNVSRGLPVLSQIQVVDPCSDFVRECLPLLPSDVDRFRCMSGLGHLFYSFPYYSVDFLSEIGIDFRTQDLLLDVARKILRRGVVSSL